MKVANIIIAHTNPHQLLQLIDQFPADHFHNFVHIDGRQKLREFAAVANHPNVTLLPKRRKLVWAGYGFVQVTLDALALIKRNEQRFFYINLMSGLDFPIKPPEHFYQFLVSAYKQEKREFFEILTLDVWPGAHRFERFHLIEWTIKGRYFTERIINWFLPKRKFFNGRLAPYGRSAWFTATDQFMWYCLDFLERNPEFIRYLKTVWSPDEFIWNTLIMNSQFRKNLSTGNLRYIDWSEGKVNPKVFRLEDLNILLQSQEYLARKFDERVDPIIISELAASIKLSR